MSFKAPSPRSDKRHRRQFDRDLLDLDLLLEELSDDGSSSTQTLPPPTHLGAPPLPPTTTVQPTVTTAPQTTVTAPQSTVTPPPVVIAPPTFTPPPLAIGVRSGHGGAIPRPEHFVRQYTAGGLSSGDLKKTKKALDTFEKASAETKGAALLPVINELDALRRKDREKAANPKEKKKAAYTTRADGLDQLRATAMTLMKAAATLRDKTGKGSKANTRKLRDLYASLADSATSTPTEWIGPDWLLTLLATEIKVWTRGQMTGNKPSADLEELLGDDYAVLGQLRDHTSTPAILTTTIAEALGNKGKLRLSLAPVTFGAKLDHDATTNTDYRVDVDVMPVGENAGAWMRSTAMLHELTHVSAAEAYGNTRTMLCFPKDFDDTQVQQLVATRGNLSRQLLALVSSSTTLSDSEKSALKFKGEYGSVGVQNGKGSFHGYYDNLKRSMDADELQSGLHFYNLIPKAESATLVEWDTTSIQMLGWLVFWGIPSTDPVYQKLEEMAQSAYDARQAARGRNAASVAYRY